jgi:fucose 4-O-acetylase-like acetyltransferase
MEEKTLDNCRFVKTILMILVILGHACGFWAGSLFIGEPAIPSLGVKVLSIWVGSFHIYAFALVSGYVFMFKILRGVQLVFIVPSKQDKEIAYPLCFCNALLGGSYFRILFQMGFNVSCQKVHSLY